MFPESSAILKDTWRTSCVCVCLLVHQSPCPCHRHSPYYCIKMMHILWHDTPSFAKLHIACLHISVYTFAKFRQFQLSPNPKWLRFYHRKHSCERKLNRSQWPTHKRLSIPWMVSTIASMTSFYYYIYFAYDCIACYIYIYSIRYNLWTSLAKL